MKNIIILLILAVVAWSAYGKYKATHQIASEPISSPAEYTSVAEADEPIGASSFKCDGRTMCPQMTSCAEATYFIQHCPNTKMDGNNDGVPCERQWCN